MEMQKSMRKDPTSAPQPGAASSEAAKTTETVNSTDKEQTDFWVLRLGRCSRQ